MLIGSKALIHHGIQLDRAPNDTDFIVKPEAYEKIKSVFGSKVILEKDNRFGKTLFVSGYKPLEYEIASENTTGQQLLDIIGEQQVAPLDVLYTLKLSHRYLKNNPFFIKTMRDIQLMRKHGAKLPDGLKDWYKARMKKTYDYSHPKLNTSKDGFFTDNFYLYEHDELHKSIAKYEKPAYEYIKVDTAEVQCSKDKFWSVSEEIRMLTVYEESCALALERHQVPHLYKPNPDTSFLMGLQKVCTSIASGFWREYAWESYDSVVEYYNQRPGEYVRKFREDVAAGKVGLWKGGENPMSEHEH